MNYHFRKPAITTSEAGKKSLIWPNLAKLIVKTR